jgi:hypothetical protein
MKPGEHISPFHGFNLEPCTVCVEEGFFNEAGLAFCRSWIVRQLTPRSETQPADSTRRVFLIQGGLCRRARQIPERFSFLPIDLARRDNGKGQPMLRKTIVALMAATLISGGSATGAIAFGGGFGGAGGGYPASFGSDYAEGGGDCHLIAQRVMTRHGWRTRQVRVCG